MFMAYAVPLGLLAGLALGGRLRGLSEARLRFVSAFGLALLVQVLLFSTAVGDTAWAHAYGPTLYVATLLLTLAALLVNVPGHGAGPLLVALGTGCNLLVILANGGAMPVLPEALRQLHGEAAAQALAQPSRLTNVALMDEQTHLALLGDRFSMPGVVPTANVFSVGDVLGAAGVALWIVELMRGRTQSAAPPTPNGIPLRRRAEP